MTRQSNSINENPKENSTEASTGDMPGHQHLHIDENPNDTTIPGGYVRRFRNARSVRDREEACADFTGYLTEKMEGEKRNFVSKFLHSKWAKRIGLLGAGALAMAAGTVVAGGAPNWMGIAWNKVGEWGSGLASSGGNLVEGGVNAWEELPDAAKFATAAAVPVGLIGAGFLGRRIIRGSKAAREERHSDLRILEAEREAIRNQSVRFKRETY